MSEKKELKGGVCGWQRIETGTWYVGIDGGQLAELACGESLEEAEQNYWKADITRLEELLVSSAKASQLSTETLRSAKATWESENEYIIAEQAMEASNVVRVENLLKESAVRLFELTGDKKPSLYAEIKEKAGVLVYDTGKAIEWCRENMKAAINEVLNTKAFESFSGAEDLEFVTKTDPVPTAQISRKKLAETVWD